MGTAVSGAPEPELDPVTKRFEPLLERAYAERDAAEINRLETWLWLDGPGQSEGRVGGAARQLALAMNAVVIANGVPEAAGASDVDAWHRLAEISVPVTVACGDLDLPFPGRPLPPARRPDSGRPAPRAGRHGPSALPGVGRRGSGADPLRRARKLVSLLAGHGLDRREPDPV